MLHKDLDDFLLDTGDILPHLLAMFFDKMLDEERDIFLPFCK